METTCFVKILQDGKVTIPIEIRQLLKIERGNIIQIKIEKPL